MSKSLDNNGLVDSSVDSIISGYENKISQNISTKILGFSKSGILPTFTDEELLYLNKKDSENIQNDPYAEVEVITPIPDITLKKGKTELNIGHAVTIIKKMEEKFPTGVNKNKAEEITRQVMSQEGEQKPITRNKFLQSINVPTEKLNIENDMDECEFPIKHMSTEIKSVNKNAYEIRESILDKSITIVNNTMNPNNLLDTNKFVDDVLNVASRLYEFVKNKGKRNH